MALKLESSLIVPAMENVQTVEPGEEGLWSNIKDSLAYMFTSDSSIAEKIGNMCYWLDKMDEDQQKELESVHVEFKMQNFVNTQIIMRFSGEAVDFCVKNLSKYESKEYFSNDEERKEITEEMEGICNQFESSHNRNLIAGLMIQPGWTGKGDPTFAQLGFTHDHLMTVAKEFKNDQAGRIGKLRKMKWIADITGVEGKNGKWEIVNVAARNFGVILKDAIKSYKYVDKFLFFAYREMKRQKIILH